ncbi:MAG: hypothetical protein II528_04260, partial [Lachnospiraceae bacterium]|nr:hypothetical protein [Lachnospiraceae bacterium]
DFLLYTGYWGEGTVELVGNDFYRLFDEPASDANGAKHWYHNNDLTDGEGVSVVMTPDKGWHVNAVRLVVSYLDENQGEIWEEYVNEENGNGRYLFEEGSPFTEKDGVVTLKLPKEAANSFFRVEATFGEDSDAGIDFRANGAKVEYRFAETEDFTELSGHYIDSAMLADNDKIQIRFTAREEESIKGVQLEMRASGMEDVCQMLPIGSDGLFTLEKVGFWKNYVIEVITWDTALDGNYRLVYDGNEAISISGGRSFNKDYAFTENQPITFSFNKNVYGVVAWPNWRDAVDVEKVGDEYRYTPESKAALTFYVFQTQEAYEEFWKPKFRVEYDEWWNDEQQPQASVSVDGLAAENGREYSYEENESINFMLSCPTERAGVTPIVEIECYDGNFYSSQSQDTEHKITIKNKKSFNFTPTNNNGFVVRIWWSEFDKIGADWERDELLIETEVEGGSVAANVTVLRSESEPGGIRVKQIVDRSALDQDSIIFTITPNEGWRLREVSVWSPDQPEERYTIRKDEDPDIWKPINEENGFAEKDGVYTYTLQNVSRFGDRHVKISAWFDKISEDWIKDGQYYVNYGDYGYENNQPKAKVLVNDSLVLPGDQNKQEFTAGVPLNFSLQPSSERAGCQPVVEI